MYNFVNFIKNCSFKKKIISKLNYNFRTRYSQVIRYLKKNPSTEKKTILEVGSGDMGLRVFIKDEFIGVDSEFKDYKTWPFDKRIGNATNLEFDNNSFDIIVSVDLLEHISPQNRKRVIAEMLRVSKKITIIVFPTSEDSERYEKKAIELFINRNQSVPKWLLEHQKYGLPKEYEIKRYIKEVMQETLKCHYKINILPNGNLKAWLFLTNLLRIGSLSYLIGNVFLILFSPLLNFLPNKNSSYRKCFIIEKEAKNKH